MSLRMSTTTIPTLSLNNSNSLTLMVLKLHDDSSNWADYKPHIWRALRSKGLWRHVERTAIAPQPYALLADVLVLADGITPTMEDKVKAREMRIYDYDKHKNLTQHVILSTCIGNKIKNLQTMHEMWDTFKVDATTKSTLFCLMQRINSSAWGLWRTTTWTCTSWRSDSTSSSWHSITITC